MANEFKIRKGLIVEGATGGTVVDIQGSLGQLFSVTDNLSGEIFAVADISGVPIMSINSSSATVFTGLVSGITPVAAANFVTKAYVDGSGGGTGPFLPVANPTFTGVLTGPSADLEFIKLTAANPGILMKETDVTDKNWDIQLNGGNLKFYEVNDARSVFSEKVTFESGGNVGIGTTNPSAKLHVNNVNAQGTTIVGRTGNNLAVSTGVGVITFPADYNSSPTNYAQIRAYSNALSGLRGSLDFNVKSTSGSLLTGLTLYGTSSGVKIGIGTDSPTQKLHVDGNALISAERYYYTAGTGAGFGSDSSGNFKIRQNDADLIFGSGNNVGIGVTNPTAKLSVEGTGTGGVPTLDVICTSASTFNHTAELITPNMTDEQNNILVIGRASSTKNAGYIGWKYKGGAGSNENILTFGHWGSDNLMNLDGVGNLGIGTQTPERILHLDANGGRPIIQIDKGGDKIFSVGTGTSANDDDNTILQMFDEGTEKIRLFTVGDSWLNGGNVGIGTTSPGNLLDVAGDTDITGQLFVTHNANYVAKIKQTATSMSNGSYTFEIDSTSHTSNMSTAGAMSVDVNSGRAFTITGQGNVGIGTTAPGSILDVVDTSGTTTLTLGRSGEIPEIKAGGTNTDLRLSAVGPGGFLQFQTNGSSRMLIQAGGNVGIGTTIPIDKLAVDGGTGDTTAQQPKIAVTRTSSTGNVLVGKMILTTSPDTTNHGNLAFQVKTIASSGESSAYYTDAITIDGRNANVGIGTTTPNAKLDVQGTQGQLFSVTDDLSGEIFAVADISGVPIMSIDTVGVSPYNTPLTVIEGEVGINRVSGNAYSLGIGTTTNGSIYAEGRIFTQTNITSSTGTITNLKVGSSLAVTSGVRLDVSGKALLRESDGVGNLYLGNYAASKFARFHTNNTDTYFDMACGDVIWRQGSGGGNHKFEHDMTNGKFTASGDIVAFGSPSDKRLKENIKPIESALDKAMKLEGVTFDWKEKGITNLKEDIGFIAQDVKKVLPELVRENEDGMLSMRHQGITPILLEAIKELKKEIEDLKKQIK